MNKVSEKSSQSPTVATVMVNYRTPDLTIDSLMALRQERPALGSYRAIVVDGASGDQSIPRLAEALKAPSLAEWTSLLQLPINGGFGWANNQAIMRLLQSDSPPDYIHLLNPDTQVEPSAIVRLVEVMEADKNCAAAGSLLLDSDGAPSGSAFRFHTPAREFVRGSRSAAVGRWFGILPTLLEEGTGEAEWVTGASVMFRASALKEAGLFDSGFFLYFEEVELMWRLARAGWKVRHVPSSRVRHLGGASTGVTYDYNQMEEAPPLPKYWFQSRRRYFALTQGRLASIWADVAWLTGHALFRLRRLVGSARSHVPHRNEGKDMWRHGLIPHARDMQPAIASWDDALDQPPAWMKN